MKFSCERCGKRYATAETPAPGRVYKLKCKACGHLIVVRASAEPSRTPPALGTPLGTSVDAPSPTPPPASELPGAAVQEGTPEISLEVSAPEQGAEGNGSTALPSGVGDATTEVSMPEISPAPTPIPAAPPGDGGYVDLFSDLGGSGATPLAKQEGEPEDPFLAAARASLPDTYGASGSAPDPFAPLRAEAQGDLDRPPPRTPPPIPKVPVIPKPPPQKTALPIALIGGGVAVLVGILAFVLIDSGKKAPPPSPSAPAPARAAAPAPVPPAPELAQAPAPAQPEPPPPAPAQPAEPPPAPPKEARRAPDDDRRQREERRRARDEAQAREAREREARERERKAREEREEREQERRERERVATAAVQEEGAAGLSQAQIEGVLRSTKKAFDGCLQGARGSEPMLDGRRVMLRLNIQPSGTVTYPTLDDVPLNGTELGACLKSAARLMVFPKFKGDTMHIEVPLVLR